MGKSRWAFDKYPEAYVKVANNKWWDGYEGEKTVIVDEFNEQLFFNDFLRWTDRYQCRVEPKGGMVQLQAERWVFTSNNPPWEFYKGKTDVERGAFRRRISTIKEVTQTDDGKGQHHDRPWGYQIAPIWSGRTTTWSV